MEIQFSFFDLLILLGIIQGIITCVMLFLTKKNPKSNKFLALGILSFSLLSTKPLLHTLSLWNTQVFGYFPNALELAVAPLIYFYVKSLLTDKFVFKKKEWIHFVPFFISQVYSFVVYFSVLQTDNFEEKRRISDNLYFDEIKQIDEYILLIATIFYLIQAYKLIKDYRDWLDNSTSDSSLPDFKWLKNLFLLFSLTAIILLISRVLSLLTFFEFINNHDFIWKFLSLYIAFLIYYLGLRGYLQPHYVFYDNENRIDDKETKISIEQEKILEQLREAMEVKKVFLNSKLNIQTLSSSLGLTQREVSQVINQSFNANFRDFINNYRIDEVKVKLKAPEYSNMSIYGIALECGFNSEASFYRLFKKYTGFTPKEYLLKMK